jgi:hypothetical protein
VTAVRDASETARQSRETAVTGPASRDGEAARTRVFDGLRDAA